ncbi:hypothetical protein AMES_3724 [Amycolatopsis mediterranei S699]|uniref:GerMN domain-containing protein n=2 Tax=Amycolatopsis mediterranei TaxID=33910 RepID=A0A0H3D5I9_AMYMU|nr:hypothetical protein [Amycolatopsis mediterranei]ADJ45547.1 hypothetical protein AMED_3768 [Amycolatopsis mediterranei U32]AEK42323.1 hypothetical protein RAM_19185 [Amycolatopsis mediterranei S699]AFO77260.1 hypothetical protein AMES_3724 [Amycolatopsis mediterranei S699]AGT84388.1 hypothetical protein B737_3724 [Amycolatopsis mediterranei RB]KDO05805.1 hypothetical protein DV26_36195 [Amycolatopsis mediterranei]
MKRIWPAVAVFLLAGCGVRPSEATDGGEAPTGLAPGMTLYLVDAHEQLRPELRRTGHLGSISDALALLLSVPSGSDLHTEIAPTPVTRVYVTPTTGVLQLSVPLTIHDVTPLGIDQLVCTALGAHVQAGGDRNTKVQVRFVQPTPESDRARTCPLITAR